MALLINKLVEDDCLLGIWEVSEDFKTLISQIRLDKEEADMVNAFTSHQRKLEWLSVRCLFKELTGLDHSICYTEHRKPFLRDNGFNISISHSKTFTSVLLSKSKRVGIDIEYMSHNIMAISPKFINDKEVITTDPKMQKYHLYIHWCAKEAIYKICDKQDINFKKNIFIAPFTPCKEGIITAMLNNSKGQEEFTLHYSRVKNYTVVWCCKG